MKIKNIFYLSIVMIFITFSFSYCSVNNKYRDNVITEQSLNKCLDSRDINSLNCLVIKTQIYAENHTDGELSFFLGMNLIYLLDISEERLANVIFNSNNILKSYPNYVKVPDISCVNSARNLYNAYVLISNEHLPDLTSEMFKKVLDEWCQHACTTGKSKYNIESKLDLN